MSNSANLALAAGASQNFTLFGGLSSVHIDAINGGTLTFEVSKDEGSTWNKVLKDEATILEMAINGQLPVIMPRGWADITETTANETLLRATLTGGTASTGTPCTVLITVLPSNS